MKSVFIALAVLALAPSGLSQSSPLSLKEGYIYLPLKGSTVTAGYGSLQNTSGEELRFSVMKAEGFKAVEVHETAIQNGMMKMQKIQTAHLKPGAAFDLKPGGHHIMLFEPTTELEVGDTVKITFLVNEKMVTLPFPIRSRTETDPL